MAGDETLTLGLPQNLQTKRRVLTRQRPREKNIHDTVLASEEEKLTIPEGDASDAQLSVNCKTSGAFRSGGAV